MPLKKSSSDKAFKENIAKEVEAKKAEGYSSEKARSIAAAISYSNKRKAQSKGK